MANMALTPLILGIHHLALPSKQSVVSSSLAAPVQSYKNSCLANVQENSHNSRQHW